MRLLREKGGRRVAAACRPGSDVRKRREGNRLDTMFEGERKP